MSTDMNLKYAFSFAACIGGNTVISPFLSWLTQTAKGNSTGAGFLTGLVISFANLGGFMSGFLYPKTNGPHHLLGNGVNIAFGFAAALGCMLLRWLLARGM